MTLRSKMLLLIVLPMLTIYVAVLGLTMAHLQEVSRDEARQHMSRLAANYAARFDDKNCVVVLKKNHSTNGDITRLTLMTVVARSHSKYFTKSFSGIHVTPC